MVQKVSEIFELIAGGKISEKDIKTLFHYCLKVGEIYARSNTKVSVKNLSKWDISEKDLVFEAVAPLFTKNRKGKLNIQQSLENWKSPVADQKDFEFFLNKIVWKRVEQKIMNLIKDSDPFFGKILKTVSVAISQNNYQKTSYFGVVYIIKSSSKRISGPVITPEEFVKIPPEYFLSKQKKLLDGLTSYLTEETDYFPAIPLNELIKKVKELYLNDPVNYINYDDSGKIEIQDLVTQAKENVISKIHTTYLNKSKLSGQDVGRITNIFNNISLDLIDGGVNSNMISYFEDSFPDVPKELYYEKYQKILNYLYKNFKEEIKSKL